MKLLSWNVNGFRAVTGKPGWKSFCDGNADIAGLQETKAHETQIADEYRGREGMYTAWLSATVRKGYSGVAVFSRPTPLAVTLELPDPAWRGEGRLIHMEFEAFHFCNVYFPNGQMGEERLAYKLGYYDAFLEYAQGLRATKPVVVCGDFNTAHRPIDLARPRANKDTSGFLPVERAWLDKFVALGYLDTFRHIHGDLPDQYSWWSYRFGAREKNVGWRIDYFFVSEELRGAVKNAWINAEIAGSDHCPVGLELAL